MRRARNERLGGGRVPAPTDHGETITGSASRRPVEIELEPISSKATRMHR